MKNTMKKGLSLFLAILMLISFIPILATAEFYSGDCGENGDNVKWELDTETKTLKISGTGYMINFATNQYGNRAPWYSYRNYIENVIVEDGIKGIEGYSFYNCSKLKTFYISKDVNYLGVYSFSGCTSLEEISFPSGLSVIGDYAFNNCPNIKDVYYDGSVKEWKNVKIYRSNSAVTNATIHYSDIYNIGEETYCFENFVDEDSAGGHCFGMAITSSGYYLGKLDKSIINLTDNKTLYSLEKSDTLKAPICHYHAIQGKARNNSIVAGGTYFKSFDIFNMQFDLFFDIESDWNEVVDYVKDRKYNGTGELIIGFKQKGKKGAHAVNFLRYDIVDDQERLYVYDNNCPHKETYFYKDDGGIIRQKSKFCDKGCLILYTEIDCIALVDVEKYLKLAEKFIVTKAIYSTNNSISIEGAYASPMLGGETTVENILYELPENTTTVTITPLVDNATFTYMGQKYSFGEIDEDTYAEFTLSTSEEDTPEFEIVNAPEDEPNTPSDPTDNCSCNCHAGGVKTFFFKLINFFQKLFGKNKGCACGVKH